MYEQFYGFREKPFHLTANPHFLYLTPKHQNALTYMEYGLRENVGFILLTGEIGTGKTTLIRYMLNQIEDDMDVAVIFNTNVTAEQLLDLVLRELEIAPAAGKPENLEKLYRHLIDRYAAGKNVLLIIDEAQNLSDEALEEVRMLSNFQSDSELLLKIMLVGQPELKNKLRKPNLAQLAQRIAVNYHLTGLSREETGTYIRSRLEKAGGKQNLFEPETVELIYRASCGIPRAINLLCDTALVYGFADELQTIQVAVVEQVIEDKGGIGLELVGPQAASLPAGVPSSDDALADTILERLQLVENTVNRLRSEVNWHLEELEGRAQSYKDEVVQQYRTLYDQERHRHDKLLRQYAHLRKEYQSALEDREGNQSAASPPVPKKDGLFGSGIFSWLKS